MRRRDLILTSLGAALAPAIARAAGRALCFVVNSGEATVSIIDMAARRELEQVPMLREPHHLMLTPDHRSVVVGDTTANTLFFLDPLSGTIQRRISASDPYQLQFSPDHKWFITTGLAINQVNIYEAGTYKQVHRVPAATMPSHLAYSPDSLIVYISLQGADSLQAIDIASGAVRYTTHIGTTPAGVLWHRGQLLIGLMGDAAFVVVDPANGQVVRKVTTQEGAHTLFPNLDGSLLYVTNRVAGSISVVDPASLNVLSTLKAPGFPDDLEFSPDGKIWAALRHAHRVGVIDPHTNEIEHIKVGRLPHGIWLNTHDHLI